MLTPAPFDGDTILPLADARVHLNLTADESYHDDAVTAARDAAISWAENYTGHSFQDREFIWTTTTFTSLMRLPIGPVTGVDGISYYDGDGTDTALDAADWFHSGNNLAAAFNTSWPYAYGQDGIRITLTAGYAVPADIPPMLLAAMKLAMTAMFEDRSSPDLTAAMRCADMFRTPLL